MSINTTELTDLWRKVTIQWKKQLEKYCAKLGITYVDRLIIDEIYKNKSLTKKELAIILFAEPQSLTRSIKRINNAGLLISRNDKNDMRFVTYTLTPKGIEIANQIEERTNQLWGKVLKGIPDKNLAAFEKSLIHILSNFTE
ncbi:MAG TPA: hypothetical protein QF753_04135 [Victivallales bacterium]|nr:hypothetical protein [Victivallales bacterium]